MARRAAPPLPAKKGGWTKAARAWWRDLWRSPVSARYLQVDRTGLAILADMLDRYARTRDESLAREIRLYGENYGLSPTSRRRLEWEIRDSAEPEPPGRRATTKRRRVDPRKVLRGEFGEGEA
jgi:hypothetical protein